MTAPEDRVVGVRGVDLAVTITAPASRPDATPWFVWGHGLASSMAREDEFGLIDHVRIARSLPMVRYDARGHGRSGSSEDLAGYHWRELAADQLALTEALGVERHVAAGASMGCATALYAALAAPRRISGLVLVIPPTAWETRAEQRALYETNALLVETGRIEELIAGAQLLPPPDPLVDDPTWREGFEREMRAADPVRLARIFRGAGVTDLPPVETLAAIDVPTLVLGWTGDPGHPVSTAERLAEIIPGAELHLAATRDELERWTDLTLDLLRSVGSSIG